jgi:hypothetical protein
MRILHIRRLLASAALVLSLGAVEARADQVFTLSGVTFDDGGTATGTLTTNDALTSLVGFDITTSPGTSIGFHYTPATAGDPSTALPFIVVLSTSSLDNILELTLTNLTVTGSPITLGTDDSFEQTPNARRVITGGELIAAGSVPEPSSLLMGGVAALTGMGIWTRRRRRASR